MLASNVPFISDTQEYKEQGLLGAVIYNPQLLNTVSTIIKASDFEIYTHRKLYSLICEYQFDIVEGEQLISLSDKIESKLGVEAFNSLGGLSYIVDLLKVRLSECLVRVYAEDIAENGRKREAKAAVMDFYKGELSQEHLIEKLLTTSNTKNRNLSFSCGSSGYEQEATFIIDDYLPARSFGVAYGSSGSYKSFHVIDWGCSVATGKQWNGKDTDKGLVVYIAGEGATGAKKRVRAWEMANKEEAKDFVIIGNAVKINTQEGLSILSSTLNEIEQQYDKSISLVIIDTLARCLEGDENSPTDMGAFVSSCDTIKERFNTTVLVVHHSGKDESKGARGHTSLRGACDFEYKISKKDGQIYELNCTKAKDSEPPQTQDFKLDLFELYTDKKGKRITSLARTAKGDKAAPRRVYSIKGDTQIEKDVISIMEIIEANGGAIVHEQLRDDFKHRLPAKTTETSQRARQRKALSMAHEKKLITSDIDSTKTIYKILTE